MDAERGDADEAKGGSDLAVAAHRQQVDRIVLPLITVSLMMGGVDKVILGTAATFGLRTDLHLAGQQYSWCSSISELTLVSSQEQGLQLMCVSLLWSDVNSLPARLALSEISDWQGMSALVHEEGSLI